MKSISVILLAFTMAVYIATKFTPVPFLGMAISIMAFPLAARISWRELFIIETIGIFFGELISFENLSSSYLIGYGMIEKLQLSTSVYSVLIVIFLVVSNLIAAVAVTSITKLLSKRIGSKRFQAVLRRS